jgi:hypothetical protein
VPRFKEEDRDIFLHLTNKLERSHKHTSVDKEFYICPLLRRHTSLEISFMFSEYFKPKGKSDSSYWFEPATKRTQEDRFVANEILNDMIDRGE